MFCDMLSMLWRRIRVFMDIDAQTILTRIEMEGRRLEAAQDLLNGFSQSHVARKFGVSRTTASRWLRALKHDGLESLKRRRATGRPSRLTREHLASLTELYAEGARAHGFPSDRWTTARLAALIQARFGVHYDPDHVGRLMHKLGLRASRIGGTKSEMPVYAASRYSPNTALSRSEISPTVA